MNNVTDLNGWISVIYMVYNNAVQFVIHRRIKKEVPQAKKQPLQSMV